MNAFDTALAYWSHVLELDASRLEQSDLDFTSTGWYVTRRPDDYLYFYYDYTCGKRVLASYEKNIQALRQAVPAEALASLTPQSAKTLDFFEDKTLVFNDLDHYLLDPQSFVPTDTTGYDLREVTEAQADDLTYFYAGCSEDNIDTLDLSFDNEYILGLYMEERLVGVTHYYVSPRAQGLAYIDVLIRASHRGQGYSRPLVSALVEYILAKGYHPHYRVKETNIPSRALVNRLGFTLTHHVMVWDLGKPHT